MRAESIKGKIETTLTQIGRFFLLSALLGMISLVGKVLMPTIGYHAVGFIFLLFVLLASLFLDTYQIITCAILSALIWDVFFIPPFGTLYIDAPQDIFMCLAYFSTAIVTGILTSQIRSREQHLQVQKDETSLLYGVAKTLAESRSSESVYKDIFAKLRESFLCDFALLKLTDDKTEVEFFDSSFWNDLISLQNDLKHLFILPGEIIIPASIASQDIYVFRLRSSGSIDRIVVIHKIQDSLSSKLDSRALENCLKQLSLHIEREYLENQSREAKRFQESERIYRTILDSISHEIKTPITTILGALGTLNNPNIRQNDLSSSELISDGIEATERLNVVVNNLLDMSRIESGHLGLRPSLCDLQDLIEQTLQGLGNSQIKQKILVTVPEKIKPLHADFPLLQQALSNLILNSAKYSPPDTQITITAKSVENFFEIIVIDEGPGVPFSERERIFNKFYQLKNPTRGGTGLGLSLVKGIAECHQGYAKCVSDGKSGSTFIVGIPASLEFDLIKGTRYEQYGQENSYC